MIRMPRYERRNEKNNRTRPSSIYIFFFFVYSVQLHGGESVELIFHSASFSPSFFCSRLFYFRVSFLILIKVTFSSIDISARMLKLARIESVR